MTCHALPGPGVIQGLEAASARGCGCVVVAEMSTSGNLATGEYTSGEEKRRERERERERERKRERAVFL